MNMHIYNHNTVITPKKISGNSLVSWNFLVSLVVLESLQWLKKKKKRFKPESTQESCIVLGVSLISFNPEQSLLPMELFPPDAIDLLGRVKSLHRIIKQICILDLSVSFCWYLICSLLYCKLEDIKLDSS